MPELPEVESVKIGLNQLVLGQEIDRVQVDWPRIIVGDLQTFINRLSGQKIININRRGKYLLFILSEWVLSSHLRMEGKYLYKTGEDLSDHQNRHVHVTFFMRDGSTLLYHDVRKFGRMQLITPDHLDHYFEAKGLGPEPTVEDFDISVFASKLGKTHRPIKPVLLDQKLVAGIGNIYADEILFRAGIHPNTPCDHLNPDQIKALHQSILEVIHQAVACGGSTIRTYRNSLGQAGKFQQALQVYGKEGQACPRCGSRICKMKLAQRGTHFCPNCQEAKKV